MKKFTLLILILLLLSFQKLFSGTPYIDWQHGFHANNPFFIQGVDSSYLMVGQDTITFPAHCLATKLDKNGSVLWQKLFAGNGPDIPFCVNKTTDEGFIIGLASNSDSGAIKSQNSHSPGTADYWILRINSSGNKVWDKTYGGENHDFPITISQTREGGFIVGGITYSDSAFEKTEHKRGAWDWWILKLNSAGNITWQKTLGGSDNDYLKTIIQTSDGQFVAIGTSKSNISGDKTENSKGGYDIWLIKLDSLGNTKWQRTIGGNQNEGEYFVPSGHFDSYCDIKQTTDKGFIVCASSASSISGDKTENSRGLFDYWILKLDSLGHITGQKTIGGSGSDYCSNILLGDNKNYIIVGFSNSNISGEKTDSSYGGYDYWVVKIDSLGSILWQKDLGGSSDDKFCSGISTLDKGYAITGYSVSPNSGNKSVSEYGNGWIVKIKETQVTSIKNELKSIQTNIYPNPFSDLIRIELSMQEYKDVSVTLFDLSGQLKIKKSYHDVNSLNEEIDLSSFSAGVYLLKIEGENEQAVYKIVKQ